MLTQFRNYFNQIRLMKLLYLESKKKKNVNPFITPSPVVLLFRIKSNGIINLRVSILYY